MLLLPGLSPVAARLLWLYLTVSCCSWAPAFLFSRSRAAPLRYRSARILHGGCARARVDYPQAC